jgi:hypothetical protein
MMAVLALVMVGGESCVDNQHRFNIAILNAVHFWQYFFYRFWGSDRTVIVLSCTFTMCCGRGTNFRIVWFSLYGLKNGNPQRQRDVTDWTPLQRYARTKIAETRVMSCAFF